MPGCGVQPADARKAGDTRADHARCGIDLEPAILAEPQNDGRHVGGVLRSLPGVQISIRGPEHDVAALLREQAALVQAEIAVGKAVDRAAAQAEHALKSDRDFADLEVDIVRSAPSANEVIAEDLRLIGAARSLGRGTHDRPQHRIAAGAEDGDAAVSRCLDRGEAKIEIACRHLRAAVAGAGEVVQGIAERGREQRLYRAIAAYILQIAVAIRARGFGELPEINLVEQEAPLHQVGQGGECRIGLRRRYIGGAEGGDQRSRLIGLHPLDQDRCVDRPGAVRRFVAEDIDILLKQVAIQRRYIGRVHIGFTQASKVHARSDAEERVDIRALGREPRVVIIADRNNAPSVAGDAGSEYGLTIYKSHIVYGRGVEERTHVAPRLQEQSSRPAEREDIALHQAAIWRECRRGDGPCGGGGDIAPGGNAGDIFAADILPGKDHVDDVVPRADPPLLGKEQGEIGQVATNGDARRNLVVRVRNSLIMIGATIGIAGVGQCHGQAKTTPEYDSARRVISKGREDARQQ